MVSAAAARNRDLGDTPVSLSVFAGRQCSHHDSGLFVDGRNGDGLRSGVGHAVSKPVRTPGNCGGTMGCDGAVFQRVFLGRCFGRGKSFICIADFSCREKRGSAVDRLVLAADFCVDAYLAATIVAVSWGRQGGAASWK